MGGGEGTEGSRGTGRAGDECCPHVATGKDVGRRMSALNAFDATYRRRSIAGGTVFRVSLRSYGMRGATVRKRHLIMRACLGCWVAMSYNRRVVIQFAWLGRLLWSVAYCALEDGETAAVAS